MNVFCACRERHLQIRFKLDYISMGFEWWSNWTLIIFRLGRLHSRGRHCRHRQRWIRLQFTRHLHRGPTITSLPQQLVLITTNPGEYILWIIPDLIIGIKLIPSKTINVSFCYKFVVFTLLKLRDVKPNYLKLYHN